MDRDAQGFLPELGRVNRVASLTSQLLAESSFEIIPMKNTLEKAATLPAGCNVSVTASPTKGVDATLDLAIALCERGYQAVPHLSARMIKDRPQLSSLIRRLQRAEIDQVFVVGGDADDPGRFPDALSLLREMADIGHDFSDVGITGYPEGHPFISGDLLRQALIDKQRYATYIATQMCFDVTGIETWIKGIRIDGVKLPVKVGIPGVSDPVKLIGIAGRIGVGTSVGFLRKNRRAVWRLMFPGAYKPTKLLKKLGELDPHLGFFGLHVFTFNQIEPTVEWWNDQKRRAG
jgi:methylenetetrahydrofolate reductase (NADPH)